MVEGTARPNAQIHKPPGLLITPVKLTWRQETNGQSANGLIQFSAYLPIGIVFVLAKFQASTVGLANPLNNQSLKLRPPSGDFMLGSATIKRLYHRTTLGTTHGLSAGQ